MDKKKVDRAYPPFFEKFVPIAIGVLGVMVGLALLMAFLIGIGVVSVG